MPGVLRAGITKADQFHPFSSTSLSTRESFFANFANFAKLLKQETAQYFSDVTYQEVYTRFGYAL
jgi:hypothetical protein